MEKAAEDQISHAAKARGRARPPTREVLSVHDRSTGGGRSMAAAESGTHACSYRGVLVCVQRAGVRVRVRPCGQSVVIVKASVTVVSLMLRPTYLISQEESSCISRVVGI